MTAHAKARITGFVLSIGIAAAAGLYIVDIVKSSLPG
jgi:hypothetical protein